MSPIFYQEYLNLSWIPQILQVFWESPGLKKMEAWGGSSRYTRPHLGTWGRYLGLNPYDEGFDIREPDALQLST